MMMMQVVDKTKRTERVEEGDIQNYKVNIYYISEQ